MRSIDILTLAFSAVSSFYLLYQLLIIICSLFINKRPAKVTDRIHSFAVCICGRNEEDVISDLIFSLKHVNYPDDKYHIFVMADNCTDKTALVSRLAGATVFERTDKEKQGKAYALKELFDIIARTEPRYDAFAVFDADNYVDADFFIHMNDHLCRGAEIVQGYRDIKNRERNAITQSYALLFCSQMRLLNMPRARLGLSAMIGGTGFAAKTSVFEGRGWFTFSMIEDMELMLDAVAEGRVVHWSKEAKIYDEQPSRLHDVNNQLTRWSKGHFQCIRICAPKLLRRLFTRDFIRIIDAFSFLLSIPLLLIGAILFVIEMILAAIGLFSVIVPILMLGVMYFGTVIVSLCAVILDRKPVKALLPGLFAFPLLLFGWTLIAFKALFTRKVEWKQIKRARCESPRGARD